MQSTPVAFISTHTVPLAMQSSTKRPPCACTAAATFVIYSSGKMIPVLVSTCGAKTTEGFSALICWTTESMSCGANCGCGELSTGWPFTTITSDGI